MRELISGLIRSSAAKGRPAAADNSSAMATVLIFINGSETQYFDLAPRVYRLYPLDTADAPVLVWLARGAVDAPRRHIMNRDELEGKKDQLKGKVKQAAGDLTDDERLH